MRKLFFTLALIGVLCTPAHAAGNWTFAAASCGSAPAPSGSIASGNIGQTQFIAVNGTIGGGTVTTCQIQLATDGKVNFDPAATPSCLADDQTAQTVLGVTFGPAVVGQAWSYGSVTLTSPGAANMAGHKVVMWCAR